MATATDIRVLVPRVRRALDLAPEQLADDDAKDVVADAIADIILHTGGLFGKQLLITHRDDAGAPDEYETSDELTLAEGSLVAIQAALNYFFHKFASLSVSEKIGDESVTWERQQSANLLRDQFKLLVDQRNAAIEAVKDEGAPLDGFESFLAVRDPYMARCLEPWFPVSSGDGQEIDYRFQ